VTTTVHDLGVSLGQWNAMVRRARLTDRQKLAALVISSYANTSGTGIHCGAARFAVDIGASYSTARRYLAWLRDVGLIELVRAGSSKAKRADEYRLILGPDLLERIEVLDPARYKALSQDIREANKDGQKVRKERAKAVHERSAKVSAHDGEDGDYERSARVSAQDAMSAQTGLHERSPMGEPPPVTQHLPKEVHAPSNTGDGVDRTELALRGPSDSKPTISPTRCSHGLSRAARADGRPACALCRVAQDRPATALPPAGHLAPVINIRTWEAS
jgi:DNA-binding transcriptional ArsR family regulator